MGGLYGRIDNLSGIFLVNKQKSILTGGKLGIICRAKKPGAEMSFFAQPRMTWAGPRLKNALGGVKIKRGFIKVAAASPKLRVGDL